MKLESLKDIEPLKNKNIISLNTIGWTGSSEDEESKDNQLIDLQTHFSFLDFLDYHNKKISVIEKILSWTKTENHEKVY